MAHITDRSIDVANLPGLEKVHPDDLPGHKRVIEDRPYLCHSHRSNDHDLFSMCLKISDEEDEKITRLWKADADGILIFTGLFSAVVAGLLAISVVDIRPELGRSAFFQLHYAGVHQVHTESDTRKSDAVIPRAIIGTPSTSSPPKYAIWVNALWFLSLALSLTCALLASLVQQWVRRYVRITQARCAPHKRVRIRSFFAEGVDKLHLPLVVEALPTLLHSSLFLFFAGLSVFLYHFESTVFKLVAVWVGICTVLYSCITFLPILRHDSPYHTPLSSFAWFLYTGLLCIIFQSLQWVTAFNFFHRERWEYFRALKDRHQKWFSHGMEKAAKDFALGLPSSIEGRALIRALETLDEDDEIEAFFQGIPAFCDSEVVSNPRAAFKTPNGERISEALVGFMCHTLSSNLIPEHIKQHRVEICTKAVEAASLSINSRIFDRILYKDWDGLLESVEFGLFLRRISYGDSFSAYYSQCITSVIIAKAQEHDRRWFELATDQFGVSETVLQDYLDNGDSPLLANCISICRRTMYAYSEHGWHRDVYSQSKTLDSVSDLDIRHTLPELRNDFCTLWNELADSARGASDRRTRSLSINILMHIRNLYIALHESTNAAPTQFSISTTGIDPILTLPFSYPLCNVPAHSPNFPYQFDEMTASAAVLHPHTHGVTAQAILDDDTQDTGSSRSVLSMSSVLAMGSGHVGIHVAG